MFNISKIKKAIGASLIALVVILSIGIIINHFQQSNNTDEMIGVSYDDSQWFNFSNFTGYKTKFDPSKVDDGANPQGQNTTVNDGDRISLRKSGLELFPVGTSSAVETPIKSIHTFRKRDGTNIMMVSYDTKIEYYDATGGIWEILKDGYTAGLSFGYADININTDATSYVYFGNGVEDFSRWTGSITHLDGALSGGEVTITVDSTDGFPSTGTITYCGTEIAYSGKAASTFTVASAHACADDKAVAESVDDSMNTNPKGNLYRAYDNRLLISGITDVEQAVYFSAYGDATTWTDLELVSASTDADADIFNLAEGGGSVTGTAMDEQNLYIFKRSLIYQVSLTDTDYTVKPLKTFDGKSQTVGAVNQKSIFTGGNAVYFITPDNQIMELARVETVDYPQNVAISDEIKPTVDLMDFSSSSGVVFRDKAYFSAKATAASPFNDVVLIWNIKHKMWDSPVLGWNVTDFTVYDNGTTEDLYIASATSPNIYKIASGAVDDIYSVTANWRSKQYGFGMPNKLKEITDIYIDGYIAENTTLTINLLLDEDGYTQTFTTELKGTDTEYIYSSSDYNAFGLSAFGTERFGSNPDLSGKDKFRIYLGKDFRATPFYVAQLEFISDGDNQDWEVLNYSMQIREYSAPIKRSLYKAFK